MPYNAETYNAVMVEKVNNLRIGNLVKIRRTSGAIQNAEVYWVINHAHYVAPERCKFGVKFIDPVRGECMKGCDAFDLVEVLADDFCKS